MKISLITENLQENISLIGKIIPQRAAVPVLSSILLEAKKEGLFVSATDLEYGVTLIIPTKTDEEGGVLIPGRQFIEVINSLGKEKIQIFQEKDQLLIDAQTGRFKFQALPKEEFPKLIEEKGEKVEEFTKEEFNDIFSKITFAVSGDDSRPHLTGVYIVEKDKGLDFVATDGYRLSLVRKTGKVPVGKIGEGIIIPPALINDVLSLKTPEKISLFVYERGNQVVFETENILLTGRLIEGKYPEYTRVIPESTGTSIIVSTEDFLKSVRAVSVFARENANVVGVKISESTLKISVPATSLGQAESDIEGFQEGPGGHISFNIKYLLDLLRVVSSKKIKIGINSPLEPALFTIPDEKDFLHVIMPVRVQE